MKHIRTLTSVLLALAFCIGINVQQAQQGNEKQTAATAPKRPKTAYYVNPVALNVSILIPPPPAVGSAANNAELAEMHWIERTRTATQVAQAKADEAEEDMFAFNTVFGPGFNPKALPITAALGDHVKNEQSVIGNQLKGYYQRPRPYQTDSSLHPVCAMKTTHDSYPSGHGLTGYLEAFTLVELVPEKRKEILTRADEYAYNRLVCGVHYRSDIEASRKVAYAVFGYMLATPKFQQDLAAARTEMRSKINLAGN